MPMSLDFLTRLAKGLAQQFGENCEVLVHDLSRPDHTIAAIENGHVTQRKLGDGPSRIVLEAMKKDPANLQDQLGYLVKTRDGRILKSSTIYLRNEEGAVEGIFSINYDITGFLMAETAIKSIVNHQAEEKPGRIPQNVNDLLDDLIDQSVANVGKPVAFMTKEDKISAIQFLNAAGAFLITKSGDKVSRHFGISKYTLYSYLDSKNEREPN